MSRVGLLGTLVLAGCVSSGIPYQPGETERLASIIDREWATRLEENPRLARRYDAPSQQPPLGSFTQSAIERRADSDRLLLAELTSIDRAALERAAQVDYDVLQKILTDRVERHAVAAYLIPFTSDTGFHISLAQLPATSDFRHADDYENYLSQLADVPRYLGEHEALLAAAIEAGMTQPQVVLEGYDVTIATHVVVDDPEASVFWDPFERMPATVSVDEQTTLRKRGRLAIADHVVPAYRSLLTFMNTRYAPSARSSTAARDLPNGDAYYQAMIRSYTGLSLSPQAIHEIGLGEVARIGSEMRAVMRRVGFSGNLQEFIAQLRTDPRFYPKSAEELLNRAKVIAKDMDGELPRFFKRLPRKPYTVQPVPDHLAPKYTAGRYVGADANSTRPGVYWVNTYDLPSRPLYAQEALTFHEAVPGHHLQGALAAELDDLKPFRRELYLSAFGEGWGLYSEWLGKEAGFYQDPYSDFGRLTYEMWRACRLVVDTGLHALGWSRQRAVDYLARHTALSLQEVNTEIDRYISWPGQALAYKLGELEIKKLRREAEQALGERFDIREFHDRILANGAVPLAVLRDEVHRYIEEAKSP